ncbi:NAD(P)H-dependent oxidoreductase, partial [Pandoraea pneumonica]|uniref:NAD(P)H-dependent oxidoreductase n=1 Tax=Pandoraea pneumonica TaxID=2508299 RepID=UPI003CEDF60B
YSVPAIMKGYIDRVWNNGLFYGGGRRTGIAAARWIGLAGESAEAFRKREYDDLIARHLNIGIAGLCGIHDSRVILLHDTLGD